MKPAPSPNACDPRSIELYLCDQLDGEQQASLESHLEQCAACRELMQSVAAEPEFWNEACAALSTDGDDHALLSSEWTGDSASIVRHDDDVAPMAESILPWLLPTDDPRMLGRLGGYEIVGIVGRGGMGIVLKGFDGALNRYLAIKVLAPHLAASGSARRRFARESQAAAAVVHENVIAIHGVSEIRTDEQDSAEPAGLPFLVMPYIRGESLQKRLDRLGPLGRIGRQMAAGLAAAHAQGLIHRDIKPANILLESGVERLQITDFGLARTVDDASMTRTGVIAGTPQYMSPEQACGEAVDTRSDLFSLGSVLYAMCTGRPPFRAETSYGILRRITDSDPRPIREIRPDTPDWLVAIIEKLHAKSANERLATAEEVSQLLEQCLAHVQQPDRQPLPADVARLLDEQRQKRLATVEKKTPRPIFLRLAAAAAVVLLVLASGWALRQQLVGERDRGSASAESSSGAPGAAASSSVPSAESWQDEVTSQLLEASRSISELEVSSEKLWDLERLPERPGSETAQP
jgi:eukaryotic-like serine/threonine-protein kinase